MTTFSEYLKKTMGWCPNAGALTRRKSMQFDNLTVNVSGSGGELTYNTTGWWNKYRNRILCNSLIITLISGYFLLGKYDIESFIRGLLFWLIVIPVTGTFEWHRLNKAATGELKKVHVKRRNIFDNYLPIFVFMIVGILAIWILTANNNIKFRNVYAIILGFIVVSWAQYVDIIYWEQKYKKILIIKKPSFYAVDAKSGANQ